MTVKALARLHSPCHNRFMKRINVFCYGDSNTYGYDPQTGLRHPSDVRWTGLLQSYLGAGFEVIEQGLNGRTTVFPEPGAEWKSGLYGLKVCLSTYKPIDIMILMLGTNDLKTYYNASAEDIAAGAETLIEVTKSFMTEKCGRAPVIILASPIELGPHIEDGPFGWEFDRESRRKSGRLASLYKAVADRQGCLFINAADYAEASPADRLHMDPPEHRKLAEAMYRAVLEAAGLRASADRSERAVLLEEWALCLLHAACSYVNARDASLRAMNLASDEEKRAAVKAALNESRMRFNQTVTDIEKDFRLCFAGDAGLCGSFFDLMTEVRTTPQNAAGSVSDFLKRSAVG